MTEENNNFIKFNRRWGWDSLVNLSSLEGIAQESLTSTKLGNFKRKQLDTSKEEKLIYDCIQNNYDGMIPRYILEGILLYEYDCSPHKMYQVVMNLTLTNKLFLINKSDGEYYSIKESNVDSV